MPLIICPPYQVNNTVVDPHWNNVSLLMHMEGTNGASVFTDEKGHTMSPSLAVTSSADKKFGNTSFYKSGGTSKITTPHAAEFVFGTGSYTIEAWLKMTTMNNGFFIFSKNASGVNSHILHVNPSGVPEVYINNVMLGANTAISSGQWNHIAEVRNGNTLMIFLNGVMVASSTNTYNFIDSHPVGIGDYTHTNFSNGIGYLDELRITKGVARYTANFTPPTEPFPHG